MTDKFLNTKKFSEMTGISVKLISKYLREGTLKGEKKSGKWQLPESELESPAVKGSSASAPADAGPSQTSGSSSNAPAAGDFSVSDFAQKTYLTEKGVLEWLAKGRIKGRKNKNGQWRISPDSFEDPAIQRLLR